MFNGTVKVVDPAERRLAQRERLVQCAEASIVDGGLEGLRARDLAQCVGCSVGAIYNLVADLDELTLLVAQRTMADLNASLDAFEREAGAACDGDGLVTLALAYAEFAARNRNRWRALFAFRMQPDKNFPAWFEADQIRLFKRLENRLERLMPKADAATLRLKARTLFSAVHGIVTLGIEEKLVALPASAVDAELTDFVRTYVKGL